MSTCSCGGVSITCPGGCGCLCAGGSDCWRWCEPTTVEAFYVRSGGDGAIARTIKNDDGTERLYLDAMVSETDLPVHTRGTVLSGCMQGSTLENMALVLGMLHGATVTVPAARAKDTLNEPISGTLEEIAERYGLTVS